MISMAMIGREFRVAGRQRRLYGMRFATGIFLLGALFLSVGVMALSGSAATGQDPFGVLTATVFGLSSLYVVAQSCGCIADELRQRTLALLLLTPVSPFGVVLGKFAARMAEGLQICLVVLPMIAVTFVMGGVTAGQFFSAWVILLAQLTLCVSVTIWCSSTTASAMRAYALAVLLLAWEVGCLPSLGWLLSWTGLTGLDSRIATFLNPVTALADQFGMAAAPFAWSLLTLGGAGLVGILALWAAASRIPWMALRDETSPAAALGRGGFKLWKFRLSRRKRRRADELRPIYWLEWGRWRSRRNVWVAILSLAVCVLNVGLQPGDMGYVTWFSGLAYWFLIISMAFSLVRSAQMLKHERLFELLLMTPVSDREWLRQRMRAAWGAFGAPLLIVTAAGGLGMGWEHFTRSTRNDWLTDLIASLMASAGIWYLVCVLSLSVGIKAKNMGNAIGTLIFFLGAAWIGIIMSAFVVAGILGLLLTTVMGVMGVGDMLGDNIKIGALALSAVGCFVIGRGIQDNLSWNFRRWLGAEMGL